MAIYSNLTAAKKKKYMIASSAKIKATDCGHIYDLVDTEADVEQGCNIKVGDYTKKGLQQRKAETPANGDAIAFVCDVPLVYRDDEDESDYINVAGKTFRAYEVVKDDVLGIDIDGFTTKLSGPGVTIGKYVTVDASRKWKEVNLMPEAGTYGFIGQIIGLEKHDYNTLVLVNVLKNETVSA